MQRDFCGPCGQNRWATRRQTTQKLSNAFGKTCNTEPKKIIKLRYTLCSLQKYAYSWEHHTHSVQLTICGRYKHVIASTHGQRTNHTNELYGFRNSLWKSKSTRSYT